MTDPILDPFRRHIVRNVRANIVGRTMFCPRTGDTLDVRKAVFLERLDDDGKLPGIGDYAVSQEGWRRILEDGTAAKLAEQGLYPLLDTIKDEGIRSVSPRLPEPPAVHPDQLTIPEA